MSQTAQTFGEKRHALLLKWTLDLATSCRLLTVLYRKLGDEKQVSRAVIAERPASEWLARNVNGHAEMLRTSIANHEVIDSYAFELEHWSKILRMAVSIAFYCDTLSCYGLHCETLALNAIVKAYRKPIESARAGLKAAITTPSEEIEMMSALSDQIRLDVFNATVEPAVLKLGIPESEVLEAITRYALAFSDIFTKPDNLAVKVQEPMTAIL